jgi:hypothetical protein
MISFGFKLSQEATFVMMEVLLVLIDAPCTFYPNVLKRFRVQIWLWLY